MFATVPALLTAHRDRLVRTAAGEGPPLELGDRRADGRGVHVRRLDDHVRGQRRSGERLLHPLVGLDHLELRRVGVRRGICHPHLDRGEGEQEQRAAGDRRGEGGPPQDAVDDPAPHPALAAVVAAPPDADLLDAVAEPRQQRGQHGERAQHRHRDDHHRCDAERSERLVAGDEHAGHRDHHGQAGDQHRPARSRGGGLERGPFAPALRSFLSLAPEVEHRVVDSDREADQEHERHRLIGHRKHVARERDKAEGAEHGRERKQQRDSRGEERPERDDQDDQRDRQGERPGLAEILAVLVHDRFRGTGVAHLADEEAGMSGLGRCDGVDHGADLVRRLVDLAADVEADEGRVPVLRDLVPMTGGERRADVPDVGLARDAGNDVVHGRVELGRAGRGGRALDQDVLGRRPLEAFVQDPVHAARLSGPGGVRIGVLGADHAADAEGDDDQGQPAERGCLPVVRAPPAHPGGQVARLAGVVGGAGHLVSSWVVDFTDARRARPAGRRRKVGFALRPADDLRCYLPTIAAPTQVGGGTRGRGVPSAA